MFKMTIQQMSVTRDGNLEVDYIAMQSEPRMRDVSCSASNASEAGARLLEYYAELVRNGSISVAELTSGKSGNGITYTDKVRDQVSPEVVNGIWCQIEKARDRIESLMIKLSQCTGDNYTVYDHQSKQLGEALKSYEFLKKWHEMSKILLDTGKLP